MKAKPPSGEVVYREPRFELRRCEIPRSDDVSEYRAVVIHPGSVVILAIDERERVILIRNKRWQIGERILELPAGTRDRPEPALDCARRELEEETGYRAKTLRPFHEFYALPGLTTEVMHAFIASDLEWVGQALEPDEDIEVVLLDRVDIRRALLAGEVIDGKTIALLSLFLLRSDQVTESTE